MIARRLSIALLLAALLIFAAPDASAQDAMPTMPDPSYGAESYRTPLDLQMPAADDASIPRGVTIPIPGGGSVQVDGPNAPADSRPSPISPWGVGQQNPNSSGTGALGP